MDATWHHVAISVKDLDRSLKFYRDLLGFEVDWEKDHYSGEALSDIVGLPEAEARVVMLKGHGARVELFQYYTPAGEASGPKRQCDFGMTHFALAVKNIHHVYELLSQAGVQFNCPPRRPRQGVWATYMKDPDGVTIELVAYE